MKFKSITSKLENIIDMVICLMLMIVTISKGGFYKEDILFPTVIISFIGLTLVVIKLIKNVRYNGVIQKSKLVTILDLFMLILPLSYALPLIFRKSLSVENSIFETIRYANMSIIYFIVRCSKNKEIYLKTLLILSCIVAIFGLDEMSYRFVEQIFPNNTIGYLADNMGNMSSIVQYANIAAIIMLVGYTITIYMYDKYKKHIYIFLNILLQACIFLTSSRMGVALVLATIVLYFIYCIKNKEGIKALKLLICTITSVLTSGVISYCAEIKLYLFVVLIPVILYALVAIIAFILPKIASKVNKKVIIYPCVLLVCLMCLISVIPTNLIINGQGTYSRKTTNFVLGENEIIIKFDADKEAKFSVIIYQIYESFKPEKIYEITSDKIVNNEIIANVRTSPGAKFVQLDYIVESGNVEIKDVQINGINIVTSYLFLPDRLAFRIKDSLTLDLNNMLRFEYYKDALEIWKTSPIFGVGGEGFKLMYQKVQDKTYISSEVHSSPLQIMVEAGLIGGLSYIVINALGLIALIKNIKYKNGKNECITLLWGLVAINIMALFDLTMSFAIMTYILAVMLGVIANKSNECKLYEKDKYEIDNKSGIAMVNLCVLAIICIVLAGIIAYSINVYRASMITLPMLPEKDNEEYNDKLYEKIVYLENKLKLDPFNLSYMTELHVAYKEYIYNLKSSTLALSDKEDSDYINKQIIEYTVRQKNNADNMIECEYHSKYALEKVASCYLDNFIYYSQIYEENFESVEVAYTFYLNYALKLVKRIQEIGPYNKVANSMYENICYNYLEELKANNKYLQSVSIQNTISELQTMLDNIQ